MYSIARARPRAAPSAMVDSDSRHARPVARAAWVPLAAVAQLRTKMAGAKQRPPSLQSVPSRDAGASPRDSVLVPQTPIDTPNDTWLREVAAEMSRHSTGVSVRDRTYLLTKYRKCFVGARGVEWLLKHAFADDTESAIALGQEMLNKGLLEHVHNDQRYLNRNSAFYRFTVRRRRRRRQGSQASLNVRLPDGMELKQRLETAEAMVDDLCDWVMNLTADAESMRDCMASLEAASCAQIGAAKRGMLAQLLILAGSAVSYIIMVEAAALNWSAALCTVCAVAVPLIVLAVNRFDRIEAKARRSSELAQGSLVQTLSAHRPTLGGKLDVRRTEAIESIAAQNLHQSTDDSSSSGDDGSDSDSDNNSRILERFSSAPDSLPPQISSASASAAKIMARRSLRRGNDNMADQHQCWSSPPPDIFSVRSASYMVDHRKEPGSRPLFELLRVDFAAIDTEHQSNIAAQPGTPVDLGLCAPNDGDSDDDSLGVRILERQNVPGSQSFEPKYFGARAEIQV